MRGAYLRPSASGWCESAVPACVTDVVSSCRRLIYAKVGVVLGEGLCEDVGRVR